MDSIATQILFVVLIFAVIAAVLYCVRRLSIERLAGFNLIVDQLCNYVDSQYRRIETPAKRAEDESQVLRAIEIVLVQPLLILLLLGLATIAFEDFHRWGRATLGILAALMTFAIVGIVYIRSEGDRSSRSDDSADTF